jgi:hypothetical protein
MMATVSRGLKACRDFMVNMRKFYSALPETILSPQEFEQLTFACLRTFTTDCATINFEYVDRLSRYSTKLLFDITISSTEYHGEQPAAGFGFDVEGWMPSVIRF